MEVDEKFIAQYRQLLARVARLEQKLDGVRGNCVLKNDPTSLILDLPQSQPAATSAFTDNNVLVRITGQTLNGVALGARKYAGVRMQFIGDAGDPAAAVAMPEVYQDGGAVLVINAAGNESVGVAGTYARGWFAGSVKVGGTRYQIVMIGDRPGLFEAYLTQTGGVAGDDTSKCTFTYTVKNEAGDTLGTGVAPIANRSTDQVNGECVAALVGIARFKEDGTVRLIVAFEQMKQCCPALCDECMDAEWLAENCSATLNLTFNKTGGGTETATATLNESSGEWEASFMLGADTVNVRISCTALPGDPPQWDIALICGAYSNTHYRSATNTCCPAEGNYPKYDAGTVPIDSVDVAKP